jgi:hypothetical protein
LQELHEEEMAEEYRMVARAEIERRIRDRIDLQNAMYSDMEAKRRRREMEQQEEQVRMGAWE